MFSGGMNKSYVSEADKMLTKYDRENPKRSASQKAEVEKHRNIFNRETDKRVKW